MGLGVLEDHKLHPVPGTSPLQNLQNVSELQRSGRSIKTSKDGIILAPQPSNDPNDPLNWPLWQRDLITVVLCTAGLIASTLVSLLAANTITMMTWFGGLSITDSAMLTGYNLLGIGSSGFIFVALARVWGTRHLFILGSAIIIASTVWAGCVGHSYKSMVAARFIQGVGFAPFEGLLNAAVGELYFIHESGKRIALANLSLFGAAYLTPVIVGIATKHLGWQWTFWMVAIIMSAIFPIIVFLVPETTYVRKYDNAWHESTTSIKQDLGLREKDVAVSEVENGSDSTGSRDEMQEELVVHHPVARQLVTWKSMALFNGRKSQEPLWKLILRPFPLFFQPAILWACITQAALIAWVALIGVSLAIILLQIGFNEVSTGYMYTGAFIGATLAFVLAALVSDPGVKFLAKRNNGIFEPEFRLFLVVPLLVLGVVGLFGYGYSASHIKHGWLLLDVFFGFNVAGMTIGTIVAAQYIVDAHRDIVIESFTCLLVFKNLLCFAVIYKGTDWVFKAGPEKMFNALGYAQLAVCLSAVPLYILGKKNRSFFARYDILRLTRLR